jgi:glycerol-3-phosphate dehydrogenase (NAD(P)+)
MSLGIELGKGKTLDEILASRNSVSEGVYTASAVVEICKDKGIEMPISEAVEAIVTNKKTVNEAIETLLSRPLKAEN